MKISMDPVLFSVLVRNLYAVCILKKRVSKDMNVKSVFWVWIHLEEHFRGNPGLCKT